MTVPTIQIASPAKLNLFLHITGRRANGYHNLQTVFQLLDYGDTLSITRKPTGLSLENSLEGVPDTDNLIMRAARALQQHGNTSLGASIRMEKRLPMGGGLGGGSSNAASTLLALNQLWECHLSTSELCKIGVTLGADVPVFIAGHSAWGEGIGDELQTITLPERWFLVIKPNCEVATAKIFTHNELTRDTSPITIRAFETSGGKNDCEALVRNLYPAVDNALHWLSKFTNSARLTGTGACIFADFENRDDAQRVLDKLPDTLQGFIAKGVNRSPALKALA